MCELPLREPRDRHAVRGQPLGELREHARPVVDLDVHVERRAEIADGRARQRAPAGVVLQEARSRGADDADHVGDDRRRGLEPAGTRPFERDLADRVALEHHRVERTVHGGERMVAVDECRLHAHVEPFVDERRRAHQPDRHSELARGLDVLRSHRLDALAQHVVGRDARAEGDCREDGHLRRGIGARHILGRVGLGVAEPLRLCQRLAVVGARLHARQDEIRRSVHDAEHAMDVRHDERLA